MSHLCKPRHLFIIAGLSLSAVFCNKKPETKVTPIDPKTTYKTQNVVVVVVDGARYTETWGDSLHRFIPKRYAMLQQGVLCNAMYNNGTTATVPGHLAVTTGFYQVIRNDGTAIPEKPSFFQHWLQKYKEDSLKAWVIAAKDKLEVLSDCVQPEWKGKYRPSSDCGISGLGSGYRTDQKTFENVQTTFANHHPRLVLINFRKPDTDGHNKDSLGYLDGISQTDEYISLLWQQLQGDDFYKGKTTLIVTNDHGRHTAGHLDGYVNHGDTCDGCKHIEMFAIGPDFKTNFITNTNYSQVDISATVAKLMNIDMPYSGGKVITDIFK